jgi:hypothetical protein
VTDTTTERWTAEIEARWAFHAMRILEEYLGDDEPVTEDEWNSTEPDELEARAEITVACRALLVWLADEGMLVTPPQTRAVQRCPMEKPGQPCTVPHPEPQIFDGPAPPCVLPYGHNFHWDGHTEIWLTENVANRQLHAELATVKAERDEAREELTDLREERDPVTIDSVRASAIAGFKELRVQLLDALGLEDDHRTPLTGYVATLRAERDEARTDLARWESGQRRKGLPTIEAVPDGIQYAAALVRAQGTEGGEEHDNLLVDASQRLKGLHDAAGALLAEAVVLRAVQTATASDLVRALQREAVGVKAIRSAERALASLTADLESLVDRLAAAEAREAAVRPVVEAARTFAKAAKAWGDGRDITDQEIEEQAARYNETQAALIVAVDAVVSAPLIGAGETDSPQPEGNDPAKEVQVSPSTGDEGGTHPHDAPPIPPHPESYCHRCDGLNITWSAPSPLWNEVMRGGSINGDEIHDGIVCPVCFARMAEDTGVVSRAGWKLSADRVLVELETVTPSGRVWSEEQHRWVEPRDRFRHLPDDVSRVVEDTMERWRRDHGR